MNTKETIKEVVVVIIAVIVLALAVGYEDTSIFFVAAISFLIIITTNVIVKKIVGYFLEIDVKTKFWTWYQFWLRQDMHFKKPVPMVWLPLLIALFSNGFFYWLGILEFDVVAKTERVSKRHGLYRFTEVTEWHMAWIAVWAIIANIILVIIGYLAGFEVFARLGIYFIAWSTIPFGKMDGSKILFASRALWTVVFVVAMLLLFVGLTVI